MSHLSPVALRTSRHSSYQALSVALSCRPPWPFIFHTYGPCCTLITACVRSEEALFILSTWPIIYKFSSKLTKHLCNAQFTHWGLSS